MIPGKSWLDLVKDILGQLELAGVKCHSHAAKARGMAVPIGLAFSLPGNSCLPLRFAALRVSATDLKRKLSVVSFERADPRSNAQNNPARQ
jgi:hypothetical protein